MRRYGIGLQLVLLVCSGVASGYIWHAALTSKRNSIRFVFIGPPYQKTQLAPPPRTRTTFTRTRAGKRHVRAEATSFAQSPHAAPTRSAPQRRPHATQLASASVHSSEAATHPAATHPAAKHPARPARPPIKLKKPAPPSPPSTPPAAVTPQPAAPAPSPPTPAPEPVQAAATSTGTRPGWGHGDRNHDHTGPSSQALANPGQPSEPDQAKKPKPGK